LGLTSLDGNANFVNGTGGDFFTIVAGIDQVVPDTVG
jgi:hypothetical protein